MGALHAQQGGCKLRTCSSLRALLTSSSFCLWETRWSSIAACAHRSGMSACYSVEVVVVLLLALLLLVMVAAAAAGVGLVR